MTLDDDACGAWEHPVEEITGIEPGREAGYRCDRLPGHDGAHSAHVDGLVVAIWVEEVPPT